MSTSRVAAFYDAAWADEAVAEAIALERHRREAIARSIERLGLRPGLRLLEVGPGRGAAAERFASARARVVAVDLSVAALERTRAAAPSVRPVRADLERLPFRRGAFDRVYANSLLMFVDLERAVGEVARVLAPGGTAVVVEPLSANPFMAAYRAVVGRYRGLARFHGLGALRRAFAGRFGDVSIEPFYLAPPACLADGRWRRAWRALDAFALALWPALARFAWIVVARLRRPGARPPVDTPGAHHVHTSG